MKRKSLGTAAGVVCGLLFAASLGFPVFYFPPETYLVGGQRAASEVPGWKVLLWGWDGMVRYNSPPTFQGHAAWLANPCFLLGMILLMRQRYRAASIVGAVTLAVALTSFRLTHTWIDPGSQRTLIGYGPGFFLWLSAMGFSFVAPVFLFFLTRVGPRVTDPPGEVYDSTAAGAGEPGR